MREAILAVVWQHPLYGLQIRNELQHRLAGIRQVNSGQVYRLIERLARDGLLVAGDHTGDGSPLYQLTDVGIKVASTWMREGSLDSANPWKGMVERVILVRSLPGTHPEALIDSYRRAWRGVLAESAVTLTDHAAHHQAQAALDWLARVHETSGHAWPVDTVRPKKGRPAKHGGACGA